MRLRRCRLIEAIPAGGLRDVLAQGLPGIALGEDVLCQTFRAINPVPLLRHFKHQFLHGVSLRRAWLRRKRGLGAEARPRRTTFFVFFVSLVYTARMHAL